MSCRNCCNSICRVLYNGRTSVWFIICENFNKIECCTKVISEISVWNCRKELDLWCSCKMRVVVVFHWKICKLGRDGFQTHLCFRIDSVDIRKIRVAFVKE